MNASKENCAKALDALSKEEPVMRPDSYNTVKVFLEAAMRKLPREESFNRPLSNKPN